jgi:hypothetical protein
MASLQEPKAKAQAHLEVEMKCMDTAKKAVQAQCSTALDEFRSYFYAPPATWHVLKALFRLLKRDGALGKSWRQALSVINVSLFDQLSKFDITTDHDAASWKAIRCAYKGAGDPAVALKRWQYDMPRSCMGAFLMLFIKQVRTCHGFVCTNR